MIAVEGPGSEVITLRELINVVVELFATSEAGILPADHRVGVTTSGDFAASTEYADIRLIAIIADVNPVFAVALQIERQVRRVDFVSVSIIEMAQANDYAALRNFELHVV